MGLDVGFYGGAGADGAGDEVAHGRGGGLDGGDLSGAELLFDEGVVEGELGESSVAKEIAAAVAYIDEPEGWGGVLSCGGSWRALRPVAVVMGGGAGGWDIEEADEGGAHAVELCGLAGAAEDSGVGGLNGGFEAGAWAEWQGVSGEGRGEVGEEGGGGEMAGDLSGGGSAHAVADDEGLDFTALGEGAGIFIALADAAGIGELRVYRLRVGHDLRTAVLPADVRGERYTEWALLQRVPWCYVRVTEGLG